MINNGPADVAFILRFWVERRELEGEAPFWRGFIEHVASGERFFIENPDQLPAFISRFLKISELVGDDPGHSSRSSAAQVSEKDV